MHASPQDVEVLKIEVEYTFGKKIASAKDCIELADAIFRKNGLLLNSNTLRRCFNLVKADYPPSVNTLNILSAYCGASSFDELINYKKSSGIFEKSEANALLKYLTAVFKNVAVPNLRDDTFIKLTHTTIDFLNQNLDIAYEFQKIIVKTSSGKRFYFEYFINIDKLNSFYGNGLRYYLSENKEEDAQIFGHAMLCFRYWLKMDLANLYYHHSKLTQLKITTEIPISICVRYFAARLFFIEANGLDSEEIIEQANNFYKQIKSSNQHHSSLACFALDFAEALILTRHYSEAYTYLTEAKSQNSFHKHTSMEIYRTLKLYNAIVLTNMGNKKRGAEIFDEVHPQDFYFIRKKFQAIFYFSLGMKLKKIKAADKQIDFLIEETGFIKMKNALAVA